MELIFSTRVPVRNDAKDCSVWERRVGVIESRFARESSISLNAGRSNAAHGDAGKGDVFNDGAVDGFKRKALALFEDAIGDGDVLEPTVGFRSAFDTPG